MKIEEGQIHWFVHEVNGTVLGFIRRQNGGALVLGGKTGSHLTGHGESYWKKKKEIIALGYMPTDIAMELKLLPSSWVPPAITSEMDREWVEKIMGEEL